MKRASIIFLGLGSIALLALGLAQPGAQAQGGGQWGNVKGKILWGGAEVPKQAPISSVKGNPDEKACTMAGKVPVLGEQWVVNPKNKGLRHTFVWLTHEDIKKKDPLPTHPDLKEPKEKEVVMDQPMCAFVPHALGLREGQVLVAKNSATINHNYKYTGNPTVNPGNNFLIAAGGTVPIKGLLADRLPVKVECNIHPWMNGWVRIYNHPYFAVTDADGNFEMKNAPAGTWRLIVWHGSGGWRGGADGREGQLVTIKAGATLDVGNLDYPPPKE